MTQTEFEALARAYVERIDPDKWYNHFIMVDEYIGFIEFMREKFEIVSKEKVREFYRAVKRKLMDEPDDFLLNRMKDKLNSLFPQTLKSEEK